MKVGYRETSREAYQTVYIGRDEQIVYSALKTMGKATNKDILAWLNDNGTRFWSINQVTGRIRGLQDKMMVKSIGKISGITNRKKVRSHVWACTGGEFDLTDKQQQELNEIINNEFKIPLKA